MKNFLKLLAFWIIATNAFAGSPVIFKGTKAKVIANQGFEMFDGKFILSSSVDPGAVATTGDIGSILLSTNGKLYVKTDNGLSTNWDEMAPISKFPVLSTDDAVTRFNGTTGDLQDSGVILSDANALTGITALTVDNMNIDGNTISSSAGNLILDSFGLTIFNDLTINTVPYIGASKEILSSAVTPTELGYVSGVTSAIQTQIDSKLNKSLTDTNIYVGNGSNEAIGVAMSGEATIANTGAITLDNDSVVNKEFGKIGSPAISTMRENYSVMNSSGVQDSIAVTDNSDGTVAVNSGSIWIRASNSATADLLSHDIAANLSLSLVDASLNYIYVDYNAGTPIYNSQTTPIIDYNTKVLVAKTYRDGTKVHINSDEHIHAGDVVSRINRRFIATDRFGYDTGGNISETGTRNFAIDAMKLWHGLHDLNTLAVDTSVADSFTYTYRDGIGGWTKVAGQTQIDNLQYDDGDGGLATLSNNNRYGVHFIYCSSDQDVWVVYGQGDYTLLQAEAAQPDGTPPEFDADTFLVGRIIIQKSAAVFTGISSAFTTTFAATGTQNHGDLSGLANDDHTQYSLADGTRNYTGFVKMPLTSANIIVGDGANLSAAVAMSGDIGIDNAGVTAIQSGVIVDGDINATAAIAHSKMAALTINRALETDGSGFLISSAITNTELNHLDGVTSLIQTQLDAKLDDFTSTTDNALIRSDGVLGEAVQDSGIIIDDTDNMTGALKITADSFNGYGKEITSNEFNLLLNPGAEEGTGSWTNANGVLTQDGTTELVGENAFKVALTAQALDFKQDVTNLQYAGLQVACESNIKSSGAGVEMCYLNGTTEIACAAYDGSDDWRELHVEGVAPSSGSMGCKFKSGSLTDDVFIDAVSLSTKSNISDISIEASYTISQLGSALTNATSEIEFNLGTATIVDNGGSIISVVDDSGGSRTKFISLIDSVFDVSMGGFIDSIGKQTSIFKNGVIVANGSQAHSSGSSSHVSSEVSMSAGDFLTFASTVDNASAFSGNFSTLGFTNRIIITAKSRAKIYSEIATSPVQFAWEGITNCNLALGTTADTGWNDVADADCIGSLDVGGATQLASGGIGFHKHLKAGRYEACFNYNSPNVSNISGTQFINLVHCSGTTACAGSSTTIASSGLFDNDSTNTSGFGSSMCGVFEVLASGDTTINLQEYSNGTATTNEIQANTARKRFQISVKPIEGYIVGVIAPVIYQSKILGGAVTANGDIAGLTISNTISGRAYTVVGQASFTHIANDASTAIRILQSGTELGAVISSNGESSVRTKVLAMSSRTFISDGTDITFNVSSVAVGDSIDATRTWVEIKSCPNCVVTTGF